MRTLAILAMIIAVSFLGEYSVGDMMLDPPLRYDGMGRANSPLALYNPSTDSYLYIPLTASKGKFIFEFQGVVYEIIPNGLSKIQVFRREP